MSRPNLEPRIDYNTEDAIITFDHPDASSLLHDYREPLPIIQDDKELKPQPWMLIHWPFLNRLNEIRGVLEDSGTPSIDAFNVHGYTDAARYLYPYSTIDEHNFDTWGWYAVSRLAKGNAGEWAKVLLFDARHLASEAAYKTVYLAKRAVRQQIGTTSFGVRTGDEQVVTEYRSCHTPDYDNVRSELTVMRHYEVPNGPNPAIFEEYAVVNAVRRVMFGAVPVMPAPNEHAHMVGRADRPADPIQTLLEKASPTDVSRLFENLPVDEVGEGPLVLIVLGPSGAGKDSLVSFLVSEGAAVEARAATNRVRRTTESEDKYIWMRPIKPTESPEEYREALIQEYNLVECAYHNGNFYGLPAASLEQSLENNAVTVVVTDNAAVTQIQERMKGKATCVSAFVIPDSISSTQGYVQSLDNPGQRMTEATQMIVDAPMVANYFVLNSRMEGGLNLAKEALLSIIDMHSDGAKK